MQPNSSVPLEVHIVLEHGSHPIRGTVLGPPPIDFTGWLELISLLSAATDADVSQAGDVAPVEKGP